MASPSREAAFTIPPDLVARAAKGDTQAFIELYDRSSPLLFALAARMLGDRQEAGALLQTVYLEIWRKSVRYDVGRGSPIAWLLTVTRARALDRLRSQPTRAHDPAGGPSDSQAPPAHASPEDRELHALVTKAVAELPAAQRQAIELAYYSGLTYAEIASRLNQPLETIKDWIRQGMTELKAALRPAWASQTRHGTRSV